MAERILASGVHNMECGGEVVVASMCRVADPASIQSGSASLPYALIQSNTPSGRCSHFWSDVSLEHTRSSGAGGAYI